MAKKSNKERKALRAQKKISNVTKKNVTRMAMRQIPQSFNFKQPRMEECLMNEDLYHGQALPRLKGRFSVPLPTMGGYIDTLLSKTDESAMLAFSSDDKADYTAVDGAKRIVRKETGRRSFRWDGKNRNQKKQAAFSGVGIGEFYTENEPKYRNIYNVVDYLDFGAEPMGGNDLQSHQHCGRINLFKSEFDLQEGADSGFYDADQVEKLIQSVSSDEKKTNEDTFKNKSDRMSRYGLDIETHDYMGDNIFSLAWWGVTYKGVRYLATLDYKVGISVRVVTCESVTGDPMLWPWEAWHTHPDEFVFWSKAPADDIRPVAVAIDILFNQALDNRQKRNFGQRAFDSSIFPNPEELEWRPDGLVEGTITKANGSLSQGIYEFQTPEVAGSIDMIGFMDQYLGTKTGITSDAQGESDETKVGIYYGNLQQVADRLGLYNKSYGDYYESIGVRFLWGMQMFLDEETAMEMIGIDGPEIAADIVDRIKPEWDVEVTGSQAEIKANAMKAEKRGGTLDKIMGNPVLMGRMNPDWVNRQLLTLGDWDDDEIEDALDLSDAADSKMIGEAELAMQLIRDGKTPRVNRSATTTFVKHITRKAINTKFDKDPKKDEQIFQKMMTYVEMHMDIVQQNMVLLGREQQRAQMIARSKQGGAEDEATIRDVGTGSPEEGTPPEGTPESTASRSASASTTGV